MQDIVYTGPKFTNKQVQFTGYISLDEPIGYVPNIIYRVNSYTWGELPDALPLKGITYTEKIVTPRWYQPKKKRRREWSLIVPNSPDIYVAVYFEKVPIQNNEFLRQPNGELQWETNAQLGTAAYYQRRSIFEAWSFQDYKIVETIIKNVPLADIDGYPQIMGKGTGGCIQQSIYAEKGLWIPYDTKESPMLLEHVLEDSAGNPISVKECISSERCGWLYEQYINGNLGEINHPVKLDEVEGRYYLGGSGNHRVCLLKRIKAHEIEAKVTIWRRCNDKNQD